MAASRNVHLSRRTSAPTRSWTANPFSQTAEQVVLIGIQQKDLLSIDSPHHNMVEGSRNVEPWTVRHAPAIIGNFEPGKTPKGQASYTPASLVVQLRPTLVLPWLSRSTLRSPSPVTAARSCPCSNNGLFGPTSPKTFFQTNSKIGTNWYSPGQSELFYLVYGHWAARSRVAGSIVGVSPERVGPLSYPLWVGVSVEC